MIKLFKLSIFLCFFSIANPAISQFQTEMLDLFPRSWDPPTKPKPKETKKILFTGNKNQRGNPSIYPVPNKTIFNGIKSFCIDSDNNKYILTKYDTVIGGTKYSTDRIMKILKQGVVTHFAGSANPFAPVQNDMPAKSARLVANKIKLDKQGNVYALSTNGVHIIDSRSLIRTLPVPLTNATDFAIDSFGKIFVVHDTLVSVINPVTYSLQTIIGGGSGVRNFITCGITKTPASAIENANTRIAIDKYNHLCLINELSIRKFVNDTIYTIAADTIKADLDMFDFSNYYYPQSIGGCLRSLDRRELLSIVPKKRKISNPNPNGLPIVIITPVILEFNLDSAKIYPLAGWGNNDNYNDSTLLDTKFENISGFDYDKNGNLFVADDSLSVVFAGYDSTNKAIALNSILNTASIADQCVSVFPFTWKGVTINSGGLYDKVIGKNAEGFDSTVVLNVNDTRATGATISGATSLCVGSNTTYTASIPNGVWSSIAGRATINASGILTGTSGGTAIVNYKVANIAGCMASTNYAVTVNAMPAVPTIGYGTNSINPQAGAPAGSFCTNRTINLVGIPSGGVWSKTGVITVNNSGVVTTGSIPGSVSLTYIYTNSNGCTNSRTISANIATCASKSAIKSDELAISNTDFVLYPNPSRSVVNLQIERWVGAGSIIVTDLYGKTVKTQPLSIGINNINVSNMSKGLYFVTVSTDNGRKTQKLIVE